MIEVQNGHFAQLVLKLKRPSKTIKGLLFQPIITTSVKLGLNPVVSVTFICNAVGERTDTAEIALFGWRF